MDRAFIRLPDSLKRAGILPVFNVIVRKQNAIVDRRAHQNALDNQQGQIINAAPENADAGYRNKHAGLDNQHKDQRDHERSG